MSFVYRKFLNLNFLRLVFPIPQARIAILQIVVVEVDHDSFCKGNNHFGGGPREGVTGNLHSKHMC